jgi:hypothetical protein
VAYLRRILILVLAVAFLAITGIVKLDLPWADPDFQVSGGLVVLYFLWSGAESARRPPRLGLPVLGMYATLLVSVVDSFLIRATTFPELLGHGLLPIRWTGLALFATGSLIRVIRPDRTGWLRLGRALQLAGLPSALGSVSGLATGLVPAMFTLRQEQAEALETEDE